MESSFFRTESPFLPGSRRIKPSTEDHASIAFSHGTNCTTNSTADKEVDSFAVVPPALQNSIIVRNLSVTWKDEKKDTEEELDKKKKKRKKKNMDVEEEVEEEEKEALKNVSFTVSRV